MKNCIAILCTALLFCGCGQNSQPQNTQIQKQQPEIWDFEEVTWYQSLYNTNAQLVIFTENGTVTNEVISLEDVAQCLGKYGWEVIQVGSENGDKVYYMKRHSKLYGQFRIDGPTDQP
jgi:hypothetical protein